MDKIRLGCDLASPKTIEDFTGAGNGATYLKGGESVKVGDRVMLTKEARREFPRMKDVDPWRVLKVHEWGKVTVERISKRTGRPWRDLWDDYWLEKVEEKRRWRASV